MGQSVSCKPREEIVLTISGPSVAIAVVFPDDGSRIISAILIAFANDFHAFHPQHVIKHLSNEMLRIIF